MHDKIAMLFILFVLNTFFVDSKDMGSFLEEGSHEGDSVLLVDGKVVVTLEKETTIKVDGWYTSILSDIGNNQLLLRGETWRWREKNQPKFWWGISKDGGAHWEPYAEKDRANLSLTPNMLTFGDGSIVGWGGGWDSSTYKGHPGEPVKFTLISASSMAELIEGRVKTKEVEISLPYMVPSMGDDMSNLIEYVLPTWGKLIEGNFGYLIQAVYSRLAFDNAPRLWVEQGMSAYQYRTCVIYSRDKGATWSYLGTVASSEQYPLPTQVEGYCEPDLLNLKDGGILCVMRSGGNPGGNSDMMERYTPLFACRSMDGGLSWSAPVPIAPYGVNPVLLRMKNGLIVCLSGRPGFFLIFSADEGKSWSSPYWISKSNGEYSRSSSGYGQLVELEPGQLGVAYDEYCTEGDEPRMVTKFKRFSIEVCR